MKLLVVSQYFWPETFIISDIVRKLAEQGHEVVVATGKPNYPDGQLFPGYHAGGIMRETFMGKVEVLRVPIRPRGRGEPFSLFLNYLSFVFFGLLCFSWLLRTRSFDAIFVFASSPITQAIPAIWLKWLKKCHLVVWVQDLWPESLAATGFITNNALLKIVGSLVRWIYAHSDTILIQSQAFEESISQYTDLEKLVYFPNSVNLGIHNNSLDHLPDDLSQLMATKFCLVFAGNLGKVQSIETLVQAALLLRDKTEIFLILVGSGSMLAWTRHQKSLLKLNNLVLPGRFTSEFMPELFHKASALLVTLRRGGVLKYTIPSKVQAYLAAGRPIVAGLEGEGAKLIEESGAGLVCEPENAEALADCIRRLYALKLEDRLAMGKQGKLYFDKNFDMNSQVNRLIEIIQSRRSHIEGSS